MKKILLSIAMLVAVSISAKAQFNLGIKGGVNFSKINTDNLKESTTTGYQAGLFARFGGAVYLQPEVYVGSRGGKFQNDNNTVSGKVTFTTLNVPLLLGGRVVGTDKVNLRVMAGPIYSYNMSKNQSFSDNFNGALVDFGNYKKSTLGYQAGAGVDIGAITADLRYEGALTKINDSYGQRPNLWALSVGFKFF
ncbi:outer membrane protein with beta-barrel domain [Mucilaginibacter yixingensis]|uniref:Outer membrane protein with beta-barrel domain n=1 Tax=Mucilaginibacter yixingensis TaxID=1295612 RepID=A0A2T5JD04_9SPHI|nr:porin family protein [Mucilaginibacter yixingensis]PTQ99642.1 outer membrane protein with beta-barrel domain [Mucilaginibacter yixingensis]